MIEFLRQVKICLVFSGINCKLLVYNERVIALGSLGLCNQKSATESQNFYLKGNVFIKTAVFTIIIF